jgi:hypothetical protein
MDVRSGLSRTEIPHVLKVIMPDCPKSRADGRHGQVNENVNHESSAHIDLSNLEMAIYEARKLTVMFGLMETKDKGALEMHILKMLERKAEEIRNERGLAECPVYIPVRACFEVLEASTSLRFHRTQLVAIISWADCFDEDGVDVDFRRFARYASDMMAGMLSGEQIKKRAKIKEEQVTDEVASNGLTEPELQKYLSDCAEHLHHKRHGHGHFHMSEGVLAKDLLKVVREIPKINLTNKEASTIVAQMPVHNDDTIYWADMIPNAYSTVLDLCRERMVTRRVELTEGSSDDEKEGQSSEAHAMEHLGKRILQILRIRTSSGRSGVHVTVAFPSESDEVDEEDVQEDHERKPVGMSGEQQELVRTVRLLTVQNQRGRQLRRIACCIRVVENDVFTFPGKAPMEIHVISFDSSLDITVDVPVRLPSCGLVDHEVAVDVSKNVMENCYLVQMPDKSLSLRVTGSEVD